MSCASVGVPESKRHMQLKENTILFLMKQNIERPSCLSSENRYWDYPDSLHLLTNVLEQGIVYRELLCQTFFVANPSCRETLRNCTQPQTLWSNMLLPCDVRSPHDEAEAVKRGVGQLVIFDNSLERASFPSMIQLHLGESVRVEGNCFLFADCIEELLFGHEQELCLRVDKSSNEPGAGHPVHLDVAARYPFHACTLRWLTGCQSDFRTRSKSFRLVHPDFSLLFPLVRHSGEEFSPLGHEQPCLHVWWCGDACYMVIMVGISLLEDVEGTLTGKHIDTPSSRVVEEIV